jgi:hypothetical protein
MNPQPVSQQWKNAVKELLLSSINEFMECFEKVDIIFFFF